ncbi:MAG TPA: hypothetical protein VNS22_04700 [Geminicoccus sp.]|uniref:hypothetical protein n=1 Tax=Geminicoccus sp. TaxID=2024832 RepID=UPI002C295BA9|nr:hypothetical protein [Geminicoccus sp.]HWL67666.1 hypothetical protein [Geminicoccus sp.]
MNAFRARLDKLQTSSASYAVELPISFATGSGRTRMVSREEVWFVTGTPLRPGEWITGQLRFREIDRLDTVVRYGAEVLLVRPVAPGSRQREVRARFCQLRFEAGTGPDRPEDQPS